MLYLLDKDVRTVRWNGEPLHEATSAIVKETMNGDFTLTVKYPISDSGIYQLIQEDMLIKAPTPVLGAQLFRIKKPIEHNDHLEITAYHISDDVMQRSITPVSVTSQSCGMALSRMVQNTKTALGDFSFNSDIQDRRTFNTTETETLYSVLLDGKHSIVGTWEGELVRDNFAMTVKKNRGENRGVVITTHKNLKDYQRTKNSQNVVTRIHAKSTFKPEGADKETTIRVTVDSPLINSYPYINEKEYENNNAKSVEELQKWAQAKFTNQGIDKVSDAIKIEAYELDGQVVHMGDTVNLKSWKHNVDAFKKAIAYEFDALKEEYLSLTFDDKAGTGGSRTSGGLSSAADAILGVTESAQEIALEKALQNADLGFDHQAGLLRQEILDGIELARAKAEEVKRELSDTIDQRFSSFDNGPLQEAKRKAEEALRNAGASTLIAQEAKRIGLDSVAKLEEFKRQATSAQTALSGDLDVLKNTLANEIRPKQMQVETEIAKQIEALIQTKNELAGVKSAQATYEETTTRRLAELTNLANGKASKSELTQTAEELASKIASVRVGGVNLFKGSKDFSGSWVNLGNWTRESEKYQGMTVMSRVGTWFGISQAFETQKGEVYTLSFYIKSSIDRDRVNVYFTHASTNQLARTSPYMSSVNISNEWQRTSVTFEITESGFILPRIERFNTEARVYVAGLKLERGNISTDYSESPEDTSAYISTVESNFIQRADALDAGVSRLTEGLRTKADISSLNVTAENIRQSVKSLETDTQNKLNQKLSTAEFDVRASGIRQEIVNATKDKADRALVTAEAGKLRTELSTVQAYIEKDSQRQDALQRYTREETARQANAVRELVARDYVGKATHQEDVRGIERRLEAITNPQNGTIATQIANYKTAVDGRFADITSLIAGKANQTDFQRVKETSQLYERIIGNNDDSISNNIARMALTNQLFQVEVAKNASNGQNLLKGTKDFSGDWKNKSANWKTHAEKYKGVDVLFKNNSWNGIGQEIDANIGEIYTFSLWMKSDWKNDTVNFYVNRNGSVEKGWGVPSQTSIAITNEWKRYSFTFKITANGFIFPRVERLNQDTNLYVAGLKLEKGSYATPYTEAPEDTNEAIRTVQSQLAGSWSVQNLTSAGALVSGLNLGANGHNRLDGKLTHITGETLIDKAVIKSAMVDKLKTANFEAGSVTTVVLDAEAVTAEKLKVDQAFFNKLVANEAYLSQLFAKQAFITRVQSITLDASQIKTGVLTGGRIQGGTITGSSISGGTITGGTITGSSISGGTITGSSISGATLTGHTKIKLGTYGSFDTVDGGLQINVPRTANSKDGLGVQFIGSYGRGTNVPYGLYIYKDSDLTTNSTALQSDEFIMTVEGYINAKGIGWLRTGNGSVNGKLTATLGLWNSSNVSLAFGGPDNDIYYSYNGTAYGLWPIVNKHFSDSRLKENIVDCEHKALDYIHQFKFKEYDWKKQEDRPQQAHTNIGLIAQEVQEVDPTLVYENGDTMNLDNLRLTNIALKAIQELALENKKLTQRLENLENERRTA